MHTALFGEIPDDKIRGGIWIDETDTVHMIPTGDENVELLVKTMRRIDEHPEEWDQTYWIARVGNCGTACCFAGTAALLAGWEPVFRSTRSTRVERVAWAAKPGTDADLISDAARRELGLTWEQGHKLFSGDNRLDRLRRFVHELTEGAYTVPAVTP